LVLVVAAPVAEELCLRGITLARLLSWAPVWVAVAVQSAVFAILHMNLLQGLYSFVLGMALGFLYVRFRNIWLCILAHAAFNLVGCSLPMILPEGSAYPLWILLLGAAAFIAAAFAIVRLPAARVADTSAPQDMGTNPPQNEPQ
jgi:membrane protease YdiL (CAAX protease family)